MNRLSRLALILLLVGTGIPVAAADSTSAARVRQGEGTGRVSGTGRTTKGAVLAKYRARIRNTTTGQVAGETQTDERGGFLFVGLNPGGYVVEFVSIDGVVVGTSGSISLAVGAMSISGLTVTASAAAVVAGTAGALSAGAGGGLFSHTGVLAIGAAVGSGIVAIAAIKQNASPSR